MATAAAGGGMRAAAMLRYSVASRTIVLFGGTSTERRVSVASAQNVVPLVEGALAWFVAPGGAIFEVSGAALAAQERPFERDLTPAGAPSCGDLTTALDAARADDVFFLALHGGDGENGVVQRLLEERRLAFTGSGAAASAAAFDKRRAKEIVAQAGVTVLPSSLVAPGDPGLGGQLAELLGRHGRLVAKPVADGSSIGLCHVANAGGVEEAVATIRRAGVPYLVEPFAAGTELTVGVIEEGGRLEALPPSEVRLQPGRAFDFDGKYLGRGTIELTPAEVARDVTAEAQRLAVMAHRALGCEGYSRTDLIARPEGIVFLETNTLPGLTTGSFIPQQLRAAGRDLGAFVAEQLRGARRRREARSRAQAAART